MNRLRSLAFGSRLIRMPLLTEPHGYPLKTEDVTQRYGISDQAVRRLVRSKRLRAIKFAGKLRFSERDLLSFEKRNATIKAAA